MHVLSEFLLLNVLMSLGRIVHGSDIIHGEKAPKNSMQYMVSLQSERGHVCGGFLIREDFVLTAAHCVTDNVPLHHVVLGSHNLKEENAIKIKVAYTCKPKTYKNVGSGDDIMLVKLAHNAPLWNGVETISLPASEVRLEDNQSCSVAGWGNTEKHRYGVNDLRVVNVSIINPLECQEKWNYLPAKVICAGGFGTDKGFCQGDSGGPLVCDGKAVGVVSFNNHYNCDYPDVPNVYTDVSRHLPWIYQNLNEFICVP